jgi:hypothetical protein
VPTREEKALRDSQREDRPISQKETVDQIDLWWKIAIRFGHTDVAASFTSDPHAPLLSAEGYEDC